MRRLQPFQPSFHHTPHLAITVTAVAVASEKTKPKSVIIIVTTTSTITRNTAAEATVSFTVGHAAKQLIKTFVAPWSPVGIRQQRPQRKPLQRPVTNVYATAEQRFRFPATTISSRCPSVASFVPSPYASGFQSLLTLLDRRVEQLDNHRHSLRPLSVSSNLLDV